MIRYDGFNKRFGRVLAVRDLDLEVGEGETLALIGPNGSGKTTTLKAALGLVRPSAGRVLVDALDVASNERAAKLLIGYLPQRISFPQGFTAMEVMHLYASLRGTGSNTIARAIERVGLAEDADREVNEYSGGMRQRLGIAIALLGNPKVLVLDEPTASLDPTGALMVREIIKGISAEGTTVLLSSHDLTEVEALAGRIAIFVRGHVAALGSIDQIALASGVMQVSRVQPAVPGVIDIASHLFDSGRLFPGGELARLELVYRHITESWLAA